MKKWFILLAAILLPLLCSCSYQQSDPIDDMINRIPAIFDAVTQPLVEDSGFQKIYRKYAEQNTVSFVSAEKEMNSILNTKYSYGVNAYNQSNGLCDTVSMFFGDDSADRLGLYFKLLGYSKREYREEENSASFACEKDGSSYQYEASYDEDAQGFEITVLKDGSVSEAFKCRLNGAGVYKIYYDGNIKRIITSTTDGENAVEIDWYDNEFIEGFGVPEEKTGYIKYENGVLSGN